MYRHLWFFKTSNSAFPFSNPKTLDLVADLWAPTRSERARNYPVVTEKPRTLPA